MGGSSLHGVRLGAGLHGQVGPRHLGRLLLVRRPVDRGRDRRGDEASDHPMRGGRAGDPGSRSRDPRRGHARPYIRNAIELADQTDRGLAATQARIQEMGEYLTSAGTALDVARDALRELDARGAQWAPPSQVRFLESRVVGLGKAVEEAKPAVDEARVRVARARGNLEPMLYARPEVEARAAAAMAVHLVGDSAERNLRGSMAKVAEAGARLEVAMPSAGLATKEAGGCQMRPWQPEPRRGPGSRRAAEALHSGRPTSDRSDPRRHRRRRTSTDGNFRSPDRGPQ